jgi:OFA family oxalate/formate antiporter-like MFS transporter
MQNNIQRAVPNRWIVVVAGIFVQFCIGVNFAWSAFASPLTKEPYGFSRLQTQMIFSAGLVMFALSMAFISGRFQNRFGPRLTVLTGGLILGGGYVLAGFAGTNFLGIFLGVGVLAGLGIGIAYVCPIAILIRWFPDKKGMIAGCAVAGCGFGSLLWIMLTGGFKFGEWVNLTPGWNGFYGDGLNPNDIFKLYGLIFITVISIGSIFMIYPPKNFSVAPAKTDPNSIHPPTATELTEAQMVRTPQYWILFAGYAAGTMAGLMVIGIIKLFGVDTLTARGMDSAKAAVIANTTMGFFYAITNGLGRIIWGVISDKLGRKNSIILMSGSQGIMMLLFYVLGQYEIGLYIGATILGFNFGGNFALFPSAAADYFGVGRVNTNYPRVFLAYGVGGFFGPLLGGWMGDLKCWIWAFIPCGIVCLCAAVLTTRLKPVELAKAA